MRKVGFLILFSYLTIAAQAQTDDMAAPSHETSPTAAIIVGVILVLLIIIVLYRRQKRKFND
ncbi:hypothetical protein GCM10017764_19440 [Sphingobacterium griseoflavum]|uniref:Gram-positive cocci surface proteins LPxTG domain-containing protein n=1 Tax=Sphingobacterium griseoflavum TaxID=1474952 RepID=A0ABQ3HX18_9SPHI|nr:hypothetical protein GCM10017764_19440 [Sphingobacterium griseoflavum]